VAFTQPPASVVGFWRPWILAMLRRAVYAWQPGLTPTSWWRSPAENKRVRGDAESQHLFGLALDVAGPPVELARFARLAEASGLVAVSYGTHVHVQLFPAGTLRRAGVEFPTTRVA